MLAAVTAAAGAGHPAVAAMLGLGAAGLAGGVVAMAWNVHTRQIGLAAQLARHHEITGPAGDAAPVHTRNGNSVPLPPVGAAGQTPAGEANSREAEGTAREPRAARNGVRASPPPVVIEGPDTVLIGKQARYRVQPAGAQQVVAWAAGGGSVSQSADPAHPDELLLVADRPGNLTVSVRLRQGLAERRETKAVTAVANPEAAVSAFMPRLFLHEWGLVAVAVLIVGFAGALVALGSLASSDFIALVAPLAALFGVIAATRGSWR
jgi:hypothetical protein